MITASKIMKCRGRPRKDGTPRPTYAVKRKVKKLVFPSPAAVARQLRLEGVASSRSTVRRDLQRLGLRAYARPKVPPLTEEKMKARVTLCRRLLRNGSHWLRGLVFSDEKWFDTCDAGVRWQYCERGQQRNQLIGRQQMQAGPKVFVWGAISVSFKVLVIVKLPEEGGGMNHRIYIDQCLSQLVKKDLEGKVLVQDGARSHWTKEVREYLRKKKVSVLEGWVAGSCDMNTIEPLWGRVQSAVSDRGPFGAEELAQFVREEWDRIPMESIARHVLSFGKICREVVSRGGAAV